MSEATEQLTASIVLVGKFNPAIFSPAWVAKTGLVDDKALDKTTLGVIHPEVAVFEVGGFSLDVRPQRFSVEVASEPLIRVLDAVLVFFEELLPHTPITEFGINYSEIVRLKSFEQRTRFGRELAPLAPWGAWGAELGSQEGELTSGMVALTMLRKYEPAGSGERRVDIQPTSSEPDNSGVAISVNDHRKPFEHKEADGAKPAINLIRDSFDESLNSSREIVAQLTDFAMSL